jgi:hypothetical protein
VLSPLRVILLPRGSKTLKLGDGHADSCNVTAAVILLVIGTSVWVGFDSRSRDWSHSSFADKPWQWVVGCLLLWIVVFPMYLVKRGQAVAPPVGRSMVQTSGQSTVPGWTAEQLAAVGWTPQSPDTSSLGVLDPSVAANSRSFRLEGGTNVPTWVPITLVSVVLLGFTWNTGALDHTLYHVGLQRHECIQNGFGAVFCGDEATQYQNNLRDAGLAP